MSYKKTEQYDEKTTDYLKSRYKEILGHLGEDPNREGLDKTPERVAKAMQFMHSLHITHKDLRSVNILISNEKPRIADFGLAKFGNGRVGLTGMLERAEELGGTMDADHHRDRRDDLLCRPGSGGVAPDRDRQLPRRIE